MYTEYSEGFLASENNFEIAIGFLSILPYKYIPHDERYGNFHMRMVTMDQNGSEIVFIRNVTDFGVCDPDKDFIRDSNQNGFKSNITSFICADVDEIEFQGTLSSPIHRYFHIELLECEIEHLRSLPGYEDAECKSKEEVTQFFN